MDTQLDLLELEHEFTTLRDIPLCMDSAALLDQFMAESEEFIDFTLLNAELPEIECSLQVQYETIEQTAPPASPLVVAPPPAAPSAPVFSCDEEEPTFIEKSAGKFMIGQLNLNLKPRKPFKVDNSMESGSISSQRLLLPDSHYPRKRSISKMPLSELFHVMGLGHDHNAALEREEHIINLLAMDGFEVGEQTWIRDTDEPERALILENIYDKTFESFGYSKRLLEAIIRRGTYARMQSNLRRRRRRRAKHS